MRTFKHKTTKEIAKLCKDDNNFYRVNDSLVMPKRFIENTNDWTETIEEYPLSYKDLISNESYTFEEIGHLYTFNLDEGVWYNHSFDRLYNSPLKKISDNKFRLATEKEIEMLIPKNKNYPVGTKVIDTNPDTKGYVYEKQESGLWKSKINNIDGYIIAESSIGKGKRFNLLEEELCVPIGTKFQYKAGGTIYTINSIKDINQVKIVWGYDNSHAYYDISQVNEYFKEKTWIIYKEYEILSLITNSYTSITCSRIDIDAFLNKEKSTLKWQTKSIRRVSDNAIFTIGDKIKGKSGVVCTINEIWLNPNCESQVLFNHKDEGVDLQNALKSLFISDDNVVIFKGDIIYPVNTYMFNPNLPILIERSDSLSKYGKGYKHFSSKAAADDFILMNKPMVSLNEVKDNAELISNALGIVLLEKLKEIVKSKLEK
jgi:hypothetical protein